MAWIRRYGLVVVLTLLVCAGLTALGWSRMSAAHSDKSGVVGVDQFDLHTDQLVQQTSMPEQVGKIAQLVGRFRPEYTLFLDGGRMYGQSGLYVYTPFELRRGNGMSILVLRGWIPKDKSKMLTNTAWLTPLHELVVHGDLQSIPVSFPAGATAQSGPLRTSLSLEDFGGKDNPKLQPLVLRQMYSSQWSGKDIKSDFFRRHWPDKFPSAATYYRQGLALFVAAGLIALAMLVYLVTRRSK